MPIKFGLSKPTLYLVGMPFLRLTPTSMASPTDLSFSQEATPLNSLNLIHSKPPEYRAPPPSAIRSQPSGKPLFSDFNLQLISLTGTTHSPEVNRLPSEKKNISMVQVLVNSPKTSLFRLTKPVSSASFISLKLCAPFSSRCHSYSFLCPSSIFTQSRR